MLQWNSSACIHEYLVDSKENINIAKTMVVKVLTGNQSVLHFLDFFSFLIPSLQFLNQAYDFCLFEIYFKLRSWSKNVKERIITVFPNYFYAGIDYLLCLQIITLKLFFYRKVIFSKFLKKFLCYIFIRFIIFHSREKLYSKILNFPRYYA